ncbi:MAG: sugar phosphate isomerase/epimerase family protein [Chthonomonadales bacterium]
MYVSIRDDILLAAGYPTIGDGLNALNLHAVELAVGRDFSVHAPAAGSTKERYFLNRNEDVSDLRRLCEGASIRISALLLANDFNAPDIEKELDWIIRTIHAAGDLGIEAVRIDAIMHGERELPREEREALFADRVHRVLDATASAGVDLGIENHGYQGNDPQFLEDLLAAIGNPRLGLTMDTGNFYWAGHPLDEVYAILQRFAPMAKHTHIKNIAYPEAMRNVRRPLGYEYGQYVCPIPEGDIDHSRVVGYLKAAGYRRDLCIEDESLGKYSEAQRKANLRAAAEFLGSLCN